MALADKDIANMALARIGAKQVTSVTADTSVAGVQVALHYTQTRDALLRGHRWSFAKKTIGLLVAATPAVHWKYAYSLPSDFLRLAHKYCPRKDYAIEGGYFLTDCPDTALVRPNVAAATNVGGGVVGIPVTNSPLQVGQVVIIAGSVHYNGTFTLVTGTTASLLKITATYNAETFTGNESVTATTVLVDYIFQQTDPTKFDVLFVEVLSLALAVKLVMPLSGDKVLRESLQQELARTLNSAGVVNDSESRVMRGQTWLNSRRANRMY
jgi:hypothetical protein